MSSGSLHRPEHYTRGLLHQLIFESDTKAGRTFNIVLITIILISVATALLDSVHSIRDHYGSLLLVLEWFFTILFTIEYGMRLYSLKHPLRYAVSFYGIIDLLAIVPTYFSLVFPGGQYFLTFRIMRLLRIFRVLKLSEYLNEANVILTALMASRRKISVFLLTVFLLAVIMGSLMYVVEGEANGYTSIPTSIYWAIVTMTTVGYGDLAPQTAVGKMLASIIMMLGYAILAVPTGIVTVEISQASKKKVSTQACPECGAEGHDYDAKHCKYCGARL
ncbi:ion transporter [bacterium]|nr:ion transporter [bacterium]